MYECSLDRMKDKISTFSKFGDAGHGGITRYSLSPEAIMARNEFIKRMKAIGAEIEIWRTYMQHFLEVNQIFLES